MSKKVIKLTESQLKDLIGKVVREQIEQPQGPEQPFKHPQTGEVYKLPQIKSEDDLSRFINYGGGSILEKANLLSSFGLDLRNMAQKENQAIKQDINNRGKTTQFLYINSSIVDFLSVVAMYNIDPKKIKLLTNQILDLMDKKAIDKKYKEYLPMMFNQENIGYTMSQYWDSLTKLAEYQIKLISA